MIIINVKHHPREFHLPNCSSYCCYPGNRVSCSEEINCLSIILGRSLAISVLYYPRIMLRQFIISEQISPIISSPARLTRSYSCVISSWAYFGIIIL